MIEAEGILLLTFGEKVIAVKKEDMICGDMEGFRGFIIGRTNFVPFG